jgi:hypothetical protein
VSEPAEAPTPVAAADSVPEAVAERAAIVEPEAPVAHRAAIVEPAEPVRSPGAQARPSSGPSGRAVTGRAVAGRGVTGRGVVVLILGVSAVVGLLEVIVGGHRGPVFAFAFIVASGVSALVVRRRDIPTAMIAPPLIYCVLIVLLSLFDTKDISGGLATREAFYIANAFVTGAPTIWTGTIAAVLIGWYRLRTAPGRPRGRQLPT